MKHRLRQSPASEGEKPRKIRLGRHGLILRSISVAPAICTLLNGLCGFAAIHMASRSKLGQADLSQSGEIAIAAWLIFLAMVFDMLDGRLARWARKTSDFGAQLDSLCDAISFGVAPAMVMLRTVITVLRTQSINHWSYSPETLLLLERAVWGAAAIYVACAVLRLARFNVENEPDESAHLYFRGLPSPGAAALAAALVLLFVRLDNVPDAWQANPTLLAAVSVILPVSTLLAALLMVSRFRYPHLVNRFIRGKKPFSYLLKFLIVVVAVVMEPFVTAAVVCLIYAASGPVGWLLRRKPAPAIAPHAPAGQPPSAHPPPPGPQGPTRQT